MFHQKDGTGEKMFNKTPPQAFNAQSLPPNFDSAAGHQIVGGSGGAARVVPGGRFPARDQGDGQQDTKSLTREVLFSVVPAS